MTTGRESKITNDLLNSIVVENEPKLKSKPEQLPEPEPEPEL
jgi:hypothetical protein